MATTAAECILYLEEVDGSRILPIWINCADGQAIAICLSDTVLARPQTHDLLLYSFKTLGWSVDKIVLNDLKEDTFYARIVLARGGEKCVLDSRPSDAIALAVRAGCPMSVRERVFRLSQVLSKPIRRNEIGESKQTLQSPKPHDTTDDADPSP